jgi:glycine/D-amino acid oxidase-like deaminating enzyme
MKLLSLGIMLGMGLLCPPARAAQTFATDICVFGGTSAGVIAAVQATKMGQAAIVVEPGRHLGSLSSGGLGWTDIGNKAGGGGLFREFYRRLGQHHGKEEAWTFSAAMVALRRETTGGRFLRRDWQP